MPWRKELEDAGFPAIIPQLRQRLRITLERVLTEGVCQSEGLKEDAAQVVSTYRNRGHRALLEVVSEVDPA